MENKQIRHQAIQINSTYLQATPFIYSTVNLKIVSISITNLSTSPNNLLIGLNEDPSTKLLLQAGESLPLGPYRDTDLVNDNVYKFGFDDTDPLNQAVIIISSEGDKPLC